MADSRATVLAEAAYSAAEQELPRLEELVAEHQAWLRLEVVLRILLTYLPESVDPALYTPLLETLSTWSADPTQQTLGDGPPADPHAKPPKALHLLPLSMPTSLETTGEDLFVRFLVERAHRIDSETGSLVHVQKLVEPFSSRSESLRVWLASVVTPLQRLDYTFYPDAPPSYTLEAFERLRGPSGAYSLLFELLRRNQEGGNYGRDFRGVLAPWIFGDAWRARHDQSAQSVVENGDSTAEKTFNSLWKDVFGALLDHATEHHASIVALVQEWDGPRDSEWDKVVTGLPTIASLSASSQYIQLMLALLYVQEDGIGKLSAEQESLVLHRAAALLKITVPVDPRAISLDASASTLSTSLIGSVSPLHLHHEELLDSSNPLTQADPFAVQLGAFFAASTALMSGLEDPLPFQGVASLSLFGHEADQRARMQKVLHILGSHSATGDSFWREVRNKLRWLRQWNVATDGKQSPLGLFCHIKLQEMEVNILKTMAGTGRFKLLTELYINQEDNLPKPLVEQVLVEVAFAAYDNANSGNKTRGGMKKASDIIATFRHQFPNSTKFQQAHTLIQATHALSFYTLALEHGTPFLPANLRINQNPLSLIDKVLQQNPQSYTKLDDLIEIGRNFVRAGLPMPQLEETDAQENLQERALIQAERIVTAKAINASLAEGDFDTAYSYVVNRLSVPSGNGLERPSNEPGDDLLWRAAYEAGRHRSTKKDGPSQLRRIEQRMELLSQAALIAPPTALQEVLESWQACEEEFNAQRSQAVEEEEQWNAQADRTIPGGFTAGDIVPFPQKARETTRRAMQEEAPMGLFDVARGAAAAFSKSTFAPSQAGRGRGQPAQGGPPSDQLDEEGTGRVRKRDMVSSAVTGSLVSGLGWVLGANPSAEQ